MVSRRDDPSHKQKVIYHYDYRLVSETEEAPSERVAEHVEEDPPAPPGDPSVVRQAKHYLQTRGFIIVGCPEVFTVDGNPRAGRWIVEKANQLRGRNDERLFMLGGGPLVSP